MQTHSKVLLILFIVGLFVSIAVSSSKPVSSEVVIGNAEPGANGIIAGYKHWTQVNTQPQRMNFLVGTNCAMAASSEVLIRTTDNPHYDKFVRVYVNDIGNSAMMEQEFPIFPEGSVIVKEKLTTRESRSPELLTVMRKREPGYDPEKGNWEYMVFDGAGQSLQASGKLEKCQACHLHEKATDYVSRIYLPATVRERLR